MSLLSKLELKIPPVGLTLLLLAVMWLLDRYLPGIDLPVAPRMALCALLVTAGGFIAISGVRAFRRARTTVDPWNPEKSTALVTDGIFRRTRNPMYLALLLFLLAWGVYLSNPYCLIAALLFVPWINRFQIRPEERAMEDMFGNEYREYRNRVRRWI
jgi:protein-S-isoprenylcysteine O-methyltransferase Ste14